MPYEVCLRGVHAERHCIRARFSLDSAHRSSLHLVCAQVCSSLRRGLPSMKGLSVILIVSGCPKVDSCRGLTSLSHSVIGKHSVQRLWVGVDRIPVGMSSPGRSCRHDSLDTLDNLLTSVPASSLRSTVCRGKLGPLLKLLRVDDLVLLIK